MLRPNDKIGPYTLLTELGGGGFKRVWLAERREGQESRQFALGVPLELYPDIELLNQEFDAWQKASGHPNVLPVIEMAEHDGLFVFVSEYASGGTLADWLKLYNGTAPSTEAAVKMTDGILAGLEHLHAIPMLHRDLKPANVLLQDDMPRLTDFGIARLFETTFQTEVLAGTYTYLSPEALNGCYSRQTDLWAAGVILYLMLQGKPPFQHKAIAPLIRAIQQEEPEPLPASVPAPLAEIVSRSLSKDPARRFPDAATMRFALSLLHSAIQPGVETEFPLDETSAAGRPTSIPLVREPAAEFPLEETTYDFPAPPPTSYSVERENVQFKQELPFIDKSLESPAAPPSASEEKSALPTLPPAYSPPPTSSPPQADLPSVLPQAGPPSYSRMPPGSGPPAAYGQPPSAPSAPQASPARKAGYGPVSSPRPTAADSSPAKGIRKILLAILMLPFLPFLLLWEWITSRRAGNKERDRKERKQVESQNILRASAPASDSTAGRPDLPEAVFYQSEKSLVSLDSALLPPSVLNDESVIIPPLAPVVMSPAPSAAIPGGSAVVPEPQKINPPDGAEMLWIPAGTFQMGSKEQEDEQPTCSIFLDGYYIYKNPVTVGQYRRFCAATRRQMPLAPYFQWQENQPIVNVTWLDAFAYCRWVGGRLPTEAQWEKAARGTDGGTYPWGNEWDNTRCANSEADENRRSASPVGAYPLGAGPYGVLDMAGNVWEWCYDWYDEAYYQISPDRNPSGPDVGFSRVLRGGSWLCACPDDFRASRRHKSDPQFSNLDYGFRCVLTA